MRLSLRDAVYPAILTAVVVLTALGGLALAGFLLNPVARGALAGLPDHPSGGMLFHPWREVAPAAGTPADAPLWGLGGAVAGSLAATASLVLARLTLRRASSPLLLFLGIFLATVPLECLRGVAAWLVATSRPVATSLFFCRIVWWGRFTGLLALLGAALAGIEASGRRLIVLGPVLATVALAMAIAIPVDRTVFLAQLTWKLGDEEAVWFVTLVVGALVPVGLLAGAVVRRQGGLYRQAMMSALLLAARELLFLSTQPPPLAAGLACLLVGAGLFVDSARRS